MTYQEIANNVQKLSDRELNMALTVAEAEKSKNSFDREDKFTEALIKNEIAHRQAIRCREKMVNINNF